MAWGYQPKKCKYEYCSQEVQQSQAGGRVREYCNSTCRSGQHRLEAERAEQRRIAEADRQRFLQLITGTPPHLEPKLAEYRRRYGDKLLADLVYFLKEAIGEAAPTIEMAEAWQPGAAQRQQQAWHNNPAIPASIIPTLVDIQKRVSLHAAHEAAQVAIAVREAAIDEVWARVVESGIDAQSVEALHEGNRSRAIRQRNDEAAIV